jgi:hypothetical protein
MVVGGLVIGEWWIGDFYPSAASRKEGGFICRNLGEEVGVYLP